MRNMTIAFVILTLSLPTHANPAEVLPDTAPAPTSAGNAYGQATPTQTPEVLPHVSHNHDMAHSPSPEALFSVAMPSDPFGLSKSRVSTLVIPKPDAPAETINEIAEDMAIMCRILDKKLNEKPKANAQRPSTGTAYGLTIQGSHKHEITEAIYLDGYGAVFMLESAIPLTPPPATKAAPDKPGDKVWLEMKDELRTDRTHTIQMSKAKEYDPQKSEELKKLLTESLKHAANIRNINADETVTLVIKAPQAATQVRKKPGQVKSTGTKPEYGLFLAGEPVAPAAVLTISARKADIDAYAKGDQEREQFVEKVLKTEH